MYEIRGIPLGYTLQQLQLRLTIIIKVCLQYIAFICDVCCPELVELTWRVFDAAECGGK